MTHQAPVGFHSNGCSGTLISPDLFLSAGHCDYAVGDTVDFTYQRDPSGDLRPPDVYDVIEVVEEQNDADFDYAVVRLARNPGGKYGFARIGDRVPYNWELVTLMGHPDSRPKQVSTGPRVPGDANRGENWFGYQADTNPASSGSGVIGQDGLLIGVHTNGGCTQNGAGANQAMRMTALVDHSAAISAIYYGFSGASIISAGGTTCLDVHAADMRRNGGRVQLWACNGQPQQEWKLIDGAVVNASGLCLDAEASNAAMNGGAVQVWECNGQPQQRWRVEGGALVNGAGLCLDVDPAALTTNGARVQVWECNGENQQRWGIDWAPLISRGGLCLDADLAQYTTNGGTVHAWACNNQIQQTWAFIDGWIVNGGGKCLEVEASQSSTNGGRVQVWSCNGGVQQRWRFENGLLVNGAGLCLDIHAPDLRNNGARVQVWQCSGAVQQKWFKP